MPLYLTASHSSRVSKPATLRKSHSSPFSAAARIKPTRRSQSIAKEFEDESPTEKLDAVGKALPAIPVSSVKDVMDALEHTTTTMFCSLPERAGMNSVRIADVLNFQKNLPPVVTLAHIHALMSASSRVEREIASQLTCNEIRKVKIAGRGNDIGGISEVLISTKQLNRLLNESGISQSAFDAFLVLLQSHPRLVSFPSNLLQPTHVKELMQTGFLVSSSLFGATKAGSASAPLVATPSISRAASGSAAAVGGDAAFEQLGGFGSARRSSYSTHAGASGTELFLSVPNIGPYLRLLSAGRSHLLELLGKSKFREAPVYLLRERWDGAVDSDNRVSTAKRIRGEFSSILPARTKKWKEFSGLSFDWALEECIGAGLVELFETGSVGLGVRALT